MNELRKCSICERTKHVSEFHKNDRGNPRPDCKRCQSTRQRKTFQRHRYGDPVVHYLMARWAKTTPVAGTENNT